MFNVNAKDIQILKYGLSGAFFVRFSDRFLEGQGLKSWGYDALNPLKEMPCSDRRFMAITKLELMGFLIMLELTQVSCICSLFLFQTCPKSKALKTFNMFGHCGYFQIFMLARLGAAR